MNSGKLNSNDMYGHKEILNALTNAKIKNMEYDPGTMIRNNSNEANRDEDEVFILFFQFCINHS